MPEHDPDPIPPTTAEADLRAALERARRGDREALPALRAALDAHPEIWQQFGDLAAHAERSWFELIAGPDLALAEALGRKVAALKAELAGPAPTPLERLLVGRVAACWLQAHQADAAVAQAGEVSLKQADLALKRQARSHKGYLMAIAALATVRRLLPAAPPSADAPVANPERSAGHPTAASPGDQRPARWATVAPEGDEDGPVQVPANPGTLALFNHPEAVPGRDVGTGRRRGNRGRPAS